MKNRLLALTAALGASAAVLTGGAPAATAATELKTASGLTRNHDQIVVYFDHFQKPINADADAPVDLKYLGGPEITPRKQLGPALMRGLFDILVSPSSYYAGLVPEGRYVAISNRSTAALRESGEFAELQKAWKKGLNAHILAWPYWEGTTFHVYLTQKPKLSKETGISLEGVKMRTVSLYTPFLKAMGATPVEISPADVYTALQRGVVNGLAWPEGAITKYGWQEYIKAKVEPGFWRSSTMVVMNLDSYNALTKAQRDYLEAAAVTLEKESGPAQREIIKVDNAKVFKAGVERMILEGEYREAYLATVYGATWRDAKNRELTLPYEKLRGMLYEE